MNFSSDCKYIIDIIFSEYKKNGFVTEERILELSRSRNLPLSEINQICEYIFSNGVYLSNEVLEDDFILDYAHNDYTILYKEILSIEPDLEYFINYVKNIKPPRKREPQKLLPQIKDGNLYARNRLLEMYLRIALKMSLHYHKKFGFALADTIQEGAIGLIVALDKYDYNSSEKFSTYAPWWIRQIIYRYMQVGNALFVFPSHIKEKMLKICHILINKSDAYKNYYHKNIVNKVCNILSCSEHKAEKYIILFNDIFSIEMLPDETDTIVSDNDEAFTNIWRKISENKIHETLSTLSYREQKIIKLRYGIDWEKSHTLEEVGTMFNLTKERIRQIENRAIKRLQHPSRSRKIKECLE